MIRPLRSSHFIFSRSLGACSQMVKLSQSPQISPGASSIGQATSCRWIPKKLPIKESKSCQKVAIFLKKVAEKLLNFQKAAKVFLLFVLLPFWGVKDQKFAHCFLSKLYLSKSNDNIRGSFHFTWSTNSLSEWHEQSMVIYRFFLVGSIGITVIVRHLEKRATWYRWPCDKASQKSTHGGRGGGGRNIKRKTVQTFYKKTSLFMTCCVNDCIF